MSGSTRRAVAVAVAEASPSSKKLRLDDDVDDKKEYIKPPPPELKGLRFDGKLIWHEMDSEEEDEDFMMGQVTYVTQTTYDAYKAEKAAIEKMRAGRTNVSTAAEAQTRSKPKKGRWIFLISDDKRPKEKCKICLEDANHRVSWCPYRTYAPKDKPIGPCAKLVCKCCGLEGGHPDMDWIGRAVFR